LRDVKQKLSAYASKDDGWAGAAKENARPADGGGGGGGAKPPLAKAGHGDANAEIADIDSRLAALQSFLREAKSTAA
jgi:coiled-coil domain-containing protein 61